MEAITMTAIGTMAPGSAFGALAHVIRVRTTTTPNRALLVSLLSFILYVSLFQCVFYAHAQGADITINIDAAANRHVIRPEVYGVAYADTATLNDLNVTLNRQGGNPTTRYNWQQNVDNRAADFYFESIPYPSSVAGELGDTFITNARAAGAQPMLTIPLIGWVAKAGPNRSKLSSFSIAKYGPQTGNDWQYFPDAGNGIRLTGEYITGNDFQDASVLTDSTFQQQWVQHLVSRWGTAANGGVRYYLMDNESSIWHATHRDVHPTGATMDEIRGKFLDYGSKIKAIDPTAQIVGPEEWGWSGYLLSGYDQQYGSLHGWSYFPDRAGHGGMEYLPWLLDQLRQHEAGTGQRLLDVFSVHYYPQGGEFSDDTSSTMQLRRNRSTRSLWDPNYVDETWINDRVRLIPRLKEWVALYYPGLQTAVTEYNWGAENHINRATTQADILGIFGREGLDMAVRWTMPAPSTPTYKAIKMYRNYDGNRSVFGDTSVSTTTPNPDNQSAFAAIRNSDGALTVMVIGKQLSGSVTANINLANFTPQGTAQVWRLTSTNTIVPLSDIQFTGNAISTSIPQQSISLFVIPAAGAGNQPPIAQATATPTSGTAPLTVAFNGSASWDPDGTISSFEWNFGDGAAGAGVTVNHTYSTAGVFSATLTVRDNQGATNSTALSITVNLPPTTVNAPSNLTGTVSGKKVILQWTDNSNNETYFYVERAPAATGVFSRIAQLRANTTRFSQNTSRGTYRYRVQAYNQPSGVTSAYSNEVQVQVK